MNHPMTAARCAEIRQYAEDQHLPRPSDTAQLAAMLERAMQQLALVYEGGTRTPEMVELLKEWNGGAI